MLFKTFDCRFYHGLFYNTNITYTFKTHLHIMYGIEFPRAYKWVVVWWVNTK